ncbi:MAG: transglutaminase-like domain-containing protein [Planctomycetota bacterium]|jgi:hypothetical protein
MPAAVLIAALIVAVAPPSGRPPDGPLTRGDPKIYDVAFDVTVSSSAITETETEPGRTYPAGRDPGKEPPVWRYRPDFQLVNTPIVMPVVFQSTFSMVDPSSLRSQLWYGAREDPTVGERNRLDAGFPFGTHLAVMTVPQFKGQNLRWRISQRVQVWSSRIDDRLAAQVPWPREWPDEVQDGLKPQMFIESDHPVFAQTVQRVSGGGLRLVPPYLAAKDLVRYCTNEVQVVGDGEDRRALRVLHGMEMQGALATAQSGRGGPHDLVCICVAMLRAAGIPSRPVVGLEEDERGIVHFVSWGEFFLPGAGWVPFDPNELRGKGIRSKNVREPWSEFGTMKDLNERIPLAFHFIAPAAVESPQAPAIWGWDPQPDRFIAEQRITLQIVSRGSGPSDPLSR